MITCKAILRIKELEYDILRFNYKFQRDVDTKGRPCTIYYGGELSVRLESTDNIRLLQVMIDEDMPTVDGSIEVLSGDNEVCIRRIEFKEAYIYAYGEDMQSYSSLPMTTNVAISPMRMDFNDLLKIDRRWPDYNGWEKVKEKEKYVRAADSKNKSISEIYWSYGENRKRLSHKSRHYTDMNLHIKTDGYNEGDSISILIKRSDSKAIAEFVSSIDVTGTVDEKGEVVIENVLKKYKLNL